MQATPRGGGAVSVVHFPPEKFADLEKRLDSLEDEVQTLHEAQSNPGSPEQGPVPEQAVSPVSGSSGSGDLAAVQGELAKLKQGIAGMDVFVTKVPCLANMSVGGGSR